MCTEDIYTFPKCGCTCIYRNPCHAQRSHVHGSCFRVVAPPDPKPHRGLCPPCNIVAKSQRALRRTPGAYIDGTELHRERDFFAGTTWVETFEDDISEEVRASNELTRKKSWTDGVCWNARQSLDTLRENIKTWKSGKKLEALTAAEKEKDEVVPLVGSVRSSKESSRKSSKSSGKASSTSRAVKLKPSWWEKGMHWVSDRNRGCILG